ncbi:MAG: YhdH/YhfP family quinone oxidoreductase [Oscillatoria sp. Prado101]|jgi:putative YhdH/YhfP family quinone oxidoreductase|nr:YhdH/YhfP family quinone oxidoreductase [Oscillatoria sp. Prado101]
MNSPTFKAFLVTQTESGQFHTGIADKTWDDLPAGDVLIRVHYSSLNYKDALSATGQPGVTKKFPHVPGIDAAGTVVSSASHQFHENQKVIVTGFDLGMNTWGGFAEYIRVPAEWVVPLPQGLTLRESMIFGTAGLTAALCTEALEQNSITPKAGEILVTGATGGVGSMAVSILAKLGYSVAAVTGKKSQHSYLMSLGASSVLSREEVDDQSGKPLLKERWAGAIDSVGGNILATAVKSAKYSGCVAACGLVSGADLVTTVYPFILRGVRLIGIDSAKCPVSKRLPIWEKLARDWKPAVLEKMVTAITLEELPEKIDAILKGETVGRVLVALAG